MSRSGVINTEISDHLPIFLVKKKERLVMEYKYMFGRTYSSFDRMAYQNDIQNHYLWNVFWNSNSNDMELLWSYMLHIITEIADVHCPIRRMKIGNNNPHWMS